MKKIKSTFILLLLAATINNTSAQLESKNLFVPIDEPSQKAKAGFSVEHKNVRLYFIKAKPSLYREFKGMGKYTNLENAIRDSKIRVRSCRPAARSTNTLNFRNYSKDTILVSMGDVVKGGNRGSRN